jgi:hypothetical protein
MQTTRRLKAPLGRGGWPEAEFEKAKMQFGGSAATQDHLPYATQDLPQDDEGRKAIEVRGTGTHPSTEMLTAGASSYY